ncbi:Response regulator receiver protein [Nitrosarchaeum koreense MY1]|uniref:Response regulator receiver protein n=1 Tax=Nitrosarchaeum koreense MY1 TaxID=1001994 RepID=F9CWL1_9ARCH|nr:Response regulator receiver protein [Nitrosarchaeum koreense MY1]
MISLPSVLVVDDDPDSRDALSDLLELKGVEVLAKGVNGHDAVQKFSQHKPDLILMDMMMPNFDGMYGLEHIKNIDSSAKVIMITADQSQTTRDKIYRYPNTKIIAKPIDIDQLVKLIMEKSFW